MHASDSVMICIMWLELKATPTNLFFFLKCPKLDLPDPRSIKFSGLMMSSACMMSKKTTRVSRDGSAKKFWTSGGNVYIVDAVFPRNGVLWKTVVIWWHLVYEQVLALEIDMEMHFRAISTGNKSTLLRRLWCIGIHFVIGFVKPSCVHEWPRPQQWRMAHRCLGSPCFQPIKP